MAIEQQQRKNKSNEKAFFNESPAQKVSAGITTNGASPAGVAWAGSSKLLPSRRVSRILPASRVSRPLPVYPARFPCIPPASRVSRRLPVSRRPPRPCHCGLPLPPIAGSTFSASCGLGTPPPRPATAASLSLLSPAPGPSIICILGAGDFSPKLPFKNPPKLECFSKISSELL